MYTKRKLAIIIRDHSAQLAGLSSRAEELAQATRAMRRQNVIGKLSLNKSTNVIVFFYRSITSLLIKEKLITLDLKITTLQLNLVEKAIKQECGKFDSEAYLTSVNQLIEEHIQSFRELAKVRLKKVIVESGNNTNHHHFAYDPEEKIEDAIKLFNNAIKACRAAFTIFSLSSDIYFQRTALKQQLMKKKKRAIAY